MYQRAGMERFLVSNLMQRQMKYAGHVLRGSGGELSNLIIEGTIEGTRARGMRMKME